MPVIRISDATWERLKGYARPLEDSAEDVVRLALNALDAAKGKSPAFAKLEATTRTRAPKAQGRRRGGKLPQKEFRSPLLEVLMKQGGKASVKSIRELLEPKMASRLSDADYERVSSGDPRWWNAVCWERNDLVKEGLLRSDSERGVWELSSKAQELLSSSTASQKNHL